MIRVKAVVKGEEDTSPFVANFVYGDRSDEQVFVNSVGMIKERLDRGFKLNVNEVLVLYCAFVVSQLRDRKSTAEIEKDGMQLLVPENAMIGVAETLQEIVFDAAVDKMPNKRLLFRQPLKSHRIKMA